MTSNRDERPCAWVGNDGRYANGDDETPGAEQGHRRHDEAVRQLMTIADPCGVTVDGLDERRRSVRPDVQNSMWPPTSPQRRRELWAQAVFRVTAGVSPDTSFVPPRPGGTHTLENR